MKLITLVIIIAIILTIGLIALTEYSNYTFERYSQQHHCIKKTDIEGVITIYACDGGETVVR